MGSPPAPVAVPVAASRRVRHGLAAGSALLCVAGCAAPASDPGMAAIPVPHLSRVDDGLYRGAAPDAEGLRALRDLGVRTVVCLRAVHPEDPAAEALGLRVVALPLRAGLTVDPPDEGTVEEFLAVATDPASRPVFVHCAQGCDRTGALVAIYRMEVHGWNNDEAADEMLAMGFHRWFDGLLAFVRDYRPRGPPAAAR